MDIEAAIQRALVYWVKEHYPQVKIAASQNENSRHAINMGMDIGEPDLRLLFRREEVTFLYYLELKSRKGKLKPSQVKWNRDFDDHYASPNCKRDVAYGFEDAKIKIASAVGAKAIR